MILFDQLIKKRRSIRKYKPDIPSEDMICQMIACAAMAPSPSNSQPVRFIGIKSDDVKSQLQQALNRGHQKFLGLIKGDARHKRLRNRINAYKRFSEFLFSAPLIFAVGVVKDVTGFSKTLYEAGILPYDLRADTDLDISVGLALKGFILKGESLGLGSCILSAPIVFIEDIETQLNLPDISVKCLITLGYPDEVPSYIEKKEPKEIYMEI